MEEIIHYLEMKNLYYSKFLSVSTQFLEKAEENEWEDLTFFVENRERILNIIRSFDFKIAECFENVETNAAQMELYQERVKNLLSDRKEMADRIVEVDLKLISRMDDMKTETIRELKRSVKTAQQLESFTQASAEYYPKSKKHDKTA